VIIGTDFVSSNEQTNEFHTETEHFSLKNPNQTKRETIRRRESVSVYHLCTPKINS
jgi:hypothetical protein